MGEFEDFIGWFFINKIKLLFRILFYENKNYYI
jgi:hypothetical protein